MLLITKAIARLLLPPGGVLLMAAAGMATLRRRQGRLLLAASLLLLALLSLRPVADLLLIPLEQRYPPLSHWSPRPGDAVVVLGGGVHARAPEYAGRDAPSDATLQRIAFALHLTAGRGRVPLWTSGGAVLHEGEQETEGAVMRRWLVARGLPPDRVHAEEGSANTWQNALLLGPALRAAGVRRVVLVTTAWHMPRAVWCFRRLGMVVLPAPCDYSSSQQSYTPLDWLPDADALDDSVRALHEYLGLLYYRLRYGG
ncbi:MAG: YdcF family protein [Zetaproteobacteria bacterium]|nr:MAG: YdcF family protein [Zetaproteobacteria bacterium]